MSDVQRSADGVVGANETSSITSDRMITLRTAARNAGSAVLWTLEVSGFMRWLRGGLSPVELDLLFAVQEERKRTLLRWRTCDSAPATLVPIMDQLRAKAAAAGVKLPDIVLADGKGHLVKNVWYAIDQTDDVTAAAFGVSGSGGSFIFLPSGRPFALGEVEQAAADRLRAAIAKLKKENGAALLDATQASDGDEDTVEVVGPERPRIPDRTYKAKCIGHETSTIFGPKVLLKFEIVKGKHAGTELFAPYRVAGLNGSRISVTPGQRLCKTIAGLFGKAARADRLPLKELRGRVFLVRTRTVSSDSERRPLPDSLQYSVVDDVLKAEDQ